MIRTLLFALALVGATVAVAPRDAAADPGPAAIDYELTDLIGSGISATLTGFSKLDTISQPGGPPIRTLEATFTAGTRFLAADLDRFEDGTCRGLAEGYNTSFALGDTFGGYTAIGLLADAGCNARVRVDFRTNTILSFAPTDPFAPLDPF